MNKIRALYAERFLYMRRFADELDAQVNVMSYDESRAFNREVFRKSHGSMILQQSFQKQLIAFIIEFH
ncbi:MAG: hypothetical protein HYU64_17285 [Armatimonadetes bacterium]|nr:hypothetical protein [Armatimonadota bacterium]